MSKVNIYTHYSKSHEVFYNNYFLPSLRNHYTKDEVNVRVYKQDQYTQDGTFMESGWIKTMEEKLEVIIQAIQENWNKWFIFSDCDIQFFGKFVDIVEKELESVDIVAQEDIGTLCAGFFGCKGNDVMLDVFKKVLVTFKQLGNDQVALNYYRNEYKYKYLNSNQFYTIGHENKQLDSPIWDNISIPLISKSILVHHANFVVGVKNKLKLMEIVKKQYENLD